MNAPTVDKLYAQVTESILKAEAFEDAGRAAEAAAEFLRVSMLEEEIADRLPPTSEEGAIARRGTVTAALSAGLAERAQDLVERFLLEGGSVDHMRQLKAFAAEATAAAAPRSDPAVYPRARFRFRELAA